MKGRAAVFRAMTLLPKERKRITIVREGEPAILNFEPIENLAVLLRWFQSGRAPQEAARARPRHLPLNSHNGGAVLLIFVAICPEFGACNQSHRKRNRDSVFGGSQSGIFFLPGEGQERAIRSGRKFGVFRNCFPPPAVATEQAYSQPPRSTLLRARSIDRRTTDPHAFIVADMACVSGGLFPLLPGTTRRRH